MGSPGFPARLINELGAGLNDNIISILKERNPGIDAKPDDHRLHGIEPDIHWGFGVNEVVVEIKALYECTEKKYYGPVRKRDGSVAKDAQKLRKLRRDKFQGHLLQVVFFRQMPSYRYPSGRTDEGGWKHHECREYYLERHKRHNIKSQYELVRQFLGEPALPANPPDTALLALRPEMISAANRWFDRIFQPDDLSWRFDRKQLEGAAVGCAIWEY